MDLIQEIAKQVEKLPSDMPVLRFVASLWHFDASGREWRTFTPILIVSRLRIRPADASSDQ
jgi:hypothetical protein